MTGEQPTGTFRNYSHKRLRQSTLDLVQAINVVIDEYRERGYSLTVRQIHYQFVHRGWLSNTGQTYSRIQSTISEGRLAGLIDWEAIEDRGRSLMGYRTHTSPQAAIRATRASYKIDMWADQPWRPEVWVEKQALEGVVGRICNELRVDFYACKGYNSQSEQWAAGQRFADRIRRGQRPIVFHLGDHDPSGLDMTRDNRDRLSMFAGVPITVQRLALSLPQIEEFNPPPNFAKLTDSRIAGYQEMMEEAGQDPESSWELDALDPEIIHDLIRDAVGRIRDPQIWDASLLQEVEDLRTLDDLSGGTSA